MQIEAARKKNIIKNRILMNCKTISGGSIYT